jgi:hypothetical protein
MEPAKMVIMVVEQFVERTWVDQSSLGRLEPVDLQLQCAGEATVGGEHQPPEAGAQATSRS